MTESRCSQVKDATVAQADSDLWFQMRYGRLTTSKMHEVAQCKTKDGCLVEVVSGATKFKETAAVQRGKFLENDVRKEVSRIKNLKISPFWTANGRYLVSHPMASQMSMSLR